MRKIFFLLTFLTANIFAGSIRDGSLLARSDGTNVTVQWGVNDESNIRAYVIERHSGTSGDFVELATIPAVKGSNSFYEFIDQSAFKTTANVYQYRVKMLLKNGTVEYSPAVSVTHNVSSVKRTWGSLKAMFR